MPAAKGKSRGSLKANGLGLLAALAVLVGFGFVMTTDRFGDFIDTPRGRVALVGGLAAAIVAALLVRKGGAKGTGGLVLALALAAGAGYGLWRADAGSAVVQAGLMDCPTSTRTAAWATSPSGDHRCVRVPRCPRGKAPGWQAGGNEPTGTCVAKRGR